MQDREVSILRDKNTKEICMLVLRDSIRKAIIFRMITRRANYFVAVHGEPTRKW